MGLDIGNYDYFRNASVLLNLKVGEFAEASSNQNERGMQGLPFYFRVALNRFDTTSVDSIPAPREITQQTLGTDLGVDHIEPYSDELVEDIVLSFPPPQKYAVDLTITKITKRKLRLVDTEDTL